MNRFGILSLSRLRLLQTFPDLCQTLLPVKKRGHLFILLRSNDHTTGTAIHGKYRCPACFVHPVHGGPRIALEIRK